MRGVIATGDLDPRELVEKARALPQMEGSDLVVRRDLRRAPFDWSPGDLGRVRAAAGNGRCRHGRSRSRPTTSA